MPRTRRFIDSPELNEAIYRFKNYARECDCLRNLITKFARAYPYSTSRAVPASTRNS